MSLIDRIKQRCEVDVDDAELQSIIDGIRSELDGRFGSVDGQKVVHQKPTGSILKLQAPLDEAQTVIISEEVGLYLGGASEIVLGADDYRVLHEGRILERLQTGTNPALYWNGLVTVIYTPLNQCLKRDEVIVKLVGLDLVYRGFASERAGDYSIATGDQIGDRERVIATLGDRSGLGMA